MQFRGLKLIMHAFRINLGIHHFALYGLQIVFKVIFYLSAPSIFPETIKTLNLG